MWHEHVMVYFKLVLSPTLGTGWVKWIRGAIRQWRIPMEIRCNSLLDSAPAPAPRPPSPIAITTCNQTCPTRPLKWQKCSLFRKEVSYSGKLHFYKKWGPYLFIYLFIYILGVVVNRQSLNTSGLSTDGLKDRFDCINKTFQVTFRCLDSKLQGFLSLIAFGLCKLHTYVYPVGESTKCDYTKSLYKVTFLTAVIWSVLFLSPIPLIT